MKFLLHDGTSNVDVEHDPDFGFHGVVAEAVRVFDPQAYLDPSEE